MAMKSCVRSTLMNRYFVLHYIVYFTIFLTYSSLKLSSQAVRTVSCVLGNPVTMRILRVLDLQPRHQRRKRGKKRERGVEDISRISF